MTDSGQTGPIRSNQADGTEIATVLVAGGILVIGIGIALFGAGLCVNLSARRAADRAAEPPCEEIHDETDGDTNRTFSSCDTKEVTQ